MTRAHENVLHFFGCFIFQQKFQRSRVFIFLYFDVYFPRIVLVVWFQSFSIVNIIWMHLWGSLNTKRINKSLSAWNLFPERFEWKIETTQFEVLTFMWGASDIRVDIDSYVWAIGSTPSKAIKIKLIFFRSLPFIYLFNRLRVWALLRFESKTFLHFNSMHLSFCTLALPMMKQLKSFSKREMKNLKNKWCVNAFKRSRGFEHADALLKFKVKIHLWRVFHFIYISINIEQMLIRSKNHHVNSIRYELKKIVAILPINATNRSAIKVIWNVVNVWGWIGNYW